MKSSQLLVAALLIALSACASPEKAPDQAADKADAQSRPAEPPVEAEVAKPAKKKHGHLGIALDQAIGKLAEFYEVSQGPAEQGRPVHMARNKRTQGVLKAFGDAKSLSEIQFTLTLDERGVYRNDDLSVLGNVLKGAAPKWKDGETWLRKTISTMTEAPVEKSASGVTVSVKKISMANLVVVKIF